MRYKKINQWVIRGLLVLVLFTPASLRAQASANLFLPAIDDSRYLSVYGSQTLQPKQFRVGTYLHYANDPLEVGIGGIPAFSIIDHLLVADTFGSIGVTDWMQVGLSAPFALYEDFNDIIGGTSDKSVQFMDLRVESKIRLLDIDHHRVGIAILPYVNIPTGAEDHLVGNDNFTGGAKAIFDFAITEKVQVSTNLGYLLRKDQVVVNTTQADAFTFGAGLSVRPKPWLDLIAEVSGNTTASNPFGEEEETPLEIDGGARFNLPSGLQLTAGGGVGASFGFGAPDFRAILGVSYLKPRNVDLPPAPPPPQEEVLAKVEQKNIEILKKIHFEYDKAVIRPVSFRILDAIVSVLKANPNVTKVRIEGHTDSKGSDAYNMKLSQRRANAVRDYLIAHGIDEGRLTSVGYGESRAIATNEDAEGRAKNRRVEFLILEQSGSNP